MGKKVIDGDYAKPFFTRLYSRHKKMMSELVDSFPLIPIKFPRKEKPKERKITDTEVVQFAIENLHKKRCKKKS